ncbi:MAG: hypothetical protein HY893_09770 [Deltaproteobacteria bacterium]|nr:hypothetical protein [Deltaproteobacteria bacterium]
MRDKNYNPVIAMLRRRGFEVGLSNPTEYLFFPPDLDSHFEDELYEMLKKYSFRIFIRDVIKNRKAFGADDLLKYSTREWVERYIDFLLKRGVIAGIPDGGYRLKSEAVFSFGDTLEWFVANVFEREFSSPALWGVRLSGASSGGDYDVVASVEGGLVYVEVKSSPPKNVEEAEVAAFIKRAEALSPSMAIFIEDTRLRMKDKIVPFFEGLLGGKEVKRLEDETFSIEDRVFITNSKPDIVGNLAYCIRRRLRKSFWQGPI